MTSEAKPILYHNPKCSKSREALALLRARGTDVTVVEYLKNPPSPSELRALAHKLGGTPSALLRKKESEYATLGLSDASALEDVTRAIDAHPVLLERPILVVGDRAVIGRPTENLLTLLD